MIAKGRFNDYVESQVQPVMITLEGLRSFNVVITTTLFTYTIHYYVFPSF